ncbi:MAG TPA: hypothetical protein PLG31_09785 [Spirochaetota bacterium]|nr:hypothetical protein [Spirochaetota bacterium]
MIKKIHFCMMALALLAGAASAFGSDEQASAPLRFMVLDPRPDNAPANVVAEVADSLRADLRASGFIAVASREEVAAGAQKAGLASVECFESACAVSLGKALPSDKIVIGEVRRRVEKYGEQQIGPYVVKELFRDVYVITVQVVDAGTGTGELRFQEDAGGRPQLIERTRAIAKDIIEYYRRRPIERDERFKGIELDGVAFTFSFMKPLGDFANYITEGYGGTLYAAGRLVPYRNIVPILALSYYSLKDNRESIQSAWLAAISVNAGYAFQPGRSVRVLPFAGVGYLLHVIDGDKDGPDASGRYEYKKDYYYDPTVTGGCELDVAIGERLNVLFISAYTVFFERSSFGHYVTGSLGVRYQF